MSYFFLSNDLVFPPVNLASREGIIAVGGDLSVDRLLLAYSSGIFPWYSEGEPIIWWSPDPRFVLFPDDIKISKSMNKTLKKNIFKATFDTNFEEVITSCRDLRSKDGTWITDEMLNAYIDLHKAGFAHSVEIRQEKKLVGGLYGISLGKCFFGESMFHTADNASKTALIYLNDFLRHNQFIILDSQVYTKHLESFGAIHIPRTEYLNILKKGLEHKTLKGSWEGYKIDSD